jgi:hypothetical protein
MKKFVVLLVVVALTLISAMAYAADVTVGGSVQVRSRNFDQMSFDKNSVVGDQKDTQTRMMIDVNAKAGDVKGKISLWNDFETWESFETVQGVGTNSAFGIREAWLNFNFPGLPVNVTAGHQLLKLGNGFFIASMHYGSDAWVIANQSGNNTIAFVNAKVAENDTREADDADAYTILDVIKLGDNATLGVDLSNVKFRTDGSSLAETDLLNVGINFNGKVGPVALKAQFDQNMGDMTDATGASSDFTGNEIVIQGSIPVAPLTVNFTFGMGSGQDTSNDITEFQNFLDVDPQVAFMYEYKIAGPCGIHTGYCNTTALGVGATMAASSSVTVGANVWMFSASEDIPNVVAGTGVTDEIGNEIDLAVNWKVADNLTWNWNVGLFMPGDGYGKDDATGIQGILAMKF